MFSRSDVETFGPDNSKAFGGLTAQQYRYCELRADGATRGEAYKEAYEVEVDSVNATDRGRKVEANSRVVATINRMMLAKRPDPSLVPKVDRTFVLNGITSLALTASKETTQLRAYELLGKVPEIGLFTQPEAPAKPRTLEEIDKELRERLAELANMAKTVEGTARTVPADKPASAQGSGDRRRKPKE